MTCKDCARYHECKAVFDGLGYSIAEERNDVDLHCKRFVEADPPFHDEKEVRLIDANEFEKKIQSYLGGQAIGFLLVGALRNEPTIDPESLRPHAKWRLNDDGSGTCGNCHRTTVACWDYDNALRYCPDCGAKMDGEV